MTFNDAVGDNEARTAPDIQSVRITNDDAGSYSVEITIGDQPRFRQTDFLVLFQDWDGNRNTGDTDAKGAEYALQATGSAGGTTAFSFCRWNGASYACEPAASFATDTQTSATTHVVRFNLRVNWANAPATFSFNFWLGVLYTDPTTQNDFFDFAPNGGTTWTYNFLITPPDSDGDGVVGEADECPSQAAGPYDPNRNGCPGPFGKIRARYEYHWVTPATTFDMLRFHGMPRGTIVTLRTGGLQERLRVTSGGVRSRRFLRTFRNGSRIIVRATRPTFVGDYYELVINSGRVTLVNRRCLAPSGNPRPVRCTDALRGS